MSGSGRLQRRVRALVRARLSRERGRHTRRVARLAAVLAARFGVDPDLGRLAGMGHDLARELDLQTIRAVATRDGRGVDPDEERSPILLHGRAAAVILAEEAGVTDAQVLEAVRDHVAGRPAMGVLSRILFAADYLEPGRGFLAEKRRREILAGGLDDMVDVAVRDTITHLEERGRPVAQSARELVAQIARQRERV